MKILESTEGLCQLVLLFPCRETTGKSKFSKACFVKTEIRLEVVSDVS